MFNPAYTFTSELLDSFVNKEVHHFVKSTYERGMDDVIHESYLISHYHEQSKAEQHYNSIPNDKHRAILDIRKPEDLEMLRKETVPQPYYQSFSKMMHPENEERGNKLFKEHTKRYLFKETHWDLRGKVTIYPKFRYQLGELFVRITYEGDTINVPFKDIENS